MPTLLLIRHGRTTSNAAGTLAGWTPGIGLDDVGREQVARLAGRLGALPVCRVVASPLQRTLETAGPLAAAWGAEITQEEGLGECRYGGWTGRPLAELAKEDLWKVIQRAPSAAVFPAGADYPHESLAAMSARAVETVRRVDGEVLAAYGPTAVWAAVSHGDVIKAIVADALGMHLDQFQRIVVDPASVSIVRYPVGQAMVLGVNGSGADLEGIVPTQQEAESDEGQVGGGAGSGGGQPEGDDAP